MTSGNIFEDYMEAQDQIQKNKNKIMAVFMPARASKAPYHRMSVNIAIIFIWLQLDPSKSWTYLAC